MNNRFTYRRARFILGVVLSEVLFLLLIGALLFWLVPSEPRLVVQRTEWQWILWCSMVIGLIYYIGLWRRQRALSNFSESKMAIRMAPGISTGRHILRFLLWRWAIACLILAMINPRFGKKEVEVRYSGVDLMICLDVSNSMLAEDMRPNRLERAKRAISQVLDGLNGDRVGLIIFAGDAYVQLPITTDYSAAEMFLGSVRPSLVPTQGTAIGRAIELGLESFGANTEGSRSIIIITDGENHEDDALIAAQRAKESGVTVHTIGMGAPEGAPIPIYERGISRGFKKDKEGNTVISRLNESMLEQLSASGDGIFVRASDSNVGLTAILDEIESMQDNEYGTEQYADYEDRFQIFLLMGIILLLFDLVIPMKKSLFWNPEMKPAS